MVRPLLILLLCSPALAQQRDFQEAIRRSGSPAFQKAVQSAELQAGTWIVSLDEGQSQMFLPSTIRVLVLHVRLEVRVHDCRWGYEPANTCHPSPLQTSVRELDLDLVGAQRIERVDSVRLEGDHIRFEAAWFKAGDNRNPIVAPIFIDAKFSADGMRLTGTMSCGGKSRPVTFNRLRLSDALFQGDWINEGWIVGLFHIGGLETGETLATFDQVLSEDADLGVPFSGHLDGDELQLVLLGGNGPSIGFFAKLSSDHESIDGVWHWGQLGGTSFRRIKLTPVPQQ